MTTGCSAGHENTSPTPITVSCDGGRREDRPHTLKVDQSTESGGEIAQRALSVAHVQGVQGGEDW